MSNVYVKSMGLRIAPQVLDAIERMQDQPILQYMIPDVVGYSTAPVYYAIQHLRGTGMLSPMKWWITERGKLALAIWRGKQNSNAAKRRAPLKPVHSSLMEERT